MASARKITLLRVNLTIYRKKSEQSNKLVFHAIFLADELTTNQKTSENNSKVCLNSSSAYRVMLNIDKVTTVYLTCGVTDLS